MCAGKRQLDESGDGVGTVGPLNSGGLEDEVSGRGSPVPRARGENLDPYWPRRKGTTKPHRTGLEFPQRLPLDRWQDIGSQLDLIADTSAWWLGDWLVFGQDHYADRYHEAIQRTALDYKTLRNYAWVARKFSVSRRRETLSFGHHAEVASLPELEQDYWLWQAEHCQWSRNFFRRQLRESLREPAGRRSASDEPGSRLSLHFTVAQLEAFEQAARVMDVDLEDWAVLVLQQRAFQALAAEAVDRGQDEDSFEETA